MHIYYMFLVLLLLVVLLSISIKEGLDGEKKVGEIESNYDKIQKALEVYRVKFKSLVM